MKPERVTAPCWYCGYVLPLNITSHFASKGELHLCDVCSKVLEDEDAYWTKRFEEAKKLPQEDSINSLVDFTEWTFDDVIGTKFKVSPRDEAMSVLYNALVATYGTHGRVYWLEKSAGYNPEQDLVEANKLQEDDDEKKTNPANDA